MTALGVPAEVAAAALAPEMTLPPNVGEDALIDLERTHEESGAMRWAILRKVIAGIRTQIAEAFVAVSEVQRHSAKLEEKLLSESSGREAADAALRAEVEALAARLTEEMAKRREEERAALDAAVEDSARRREAADKQLREELTAERDEHRRRLDDEVAARHRAGDDALRRFDELRAGLQKLEELQKEAWEKAAGGTSALVAKEREERASSEARAMAAVETLAKELRDASARGDAEVGRFRESLQAVKQSLEALSTAQGAGEQQLAQRLAESSKEVDKKLEAQRSALEWQLEAQKKELDSLLQKRIAEEAVAREVLEQKREDAMRRIVQSLQEEAAERQAGEERAIARLEKATAEVVARAESIVESTSKDAASAFKQLLESMEQKVAKEEATRSAQVEELRDEGCELRKVLVEGLETERAARRELAAAEAKQLEDLKLEVQNCRMAQAEETRERTDLAVRLAKDLSEGDDAMLKSAKGLLEVEVAHIRTELKAEALRFDTTVAEMAKAQETALQEERGRQEVRSHSAAQEVKRALEAQADFAEALEKEQRKLSDHLAACLAVEGAKHSGLAQRVAGLQDDMGKVRDHLPILFVPAGAFG